MGWVFFYLVMSMLCAWRFHAEYLRHSKWTWYWGFIFSVNTLMTIKVLESLPLQGVIV